MKIVKSDFPPQSLQCDMFLAIGIYSNGDIYSDYFYTTEKNETYKHFEDSTNTWSTIGLRAAYKHFEWVE